MFEVAQYAPLLQTRQSEIRGYRELPDSTKDLIFPIFVLRPWPRARSIQLPIDHILAATNGRSFGLDLEEDYPQASPDNPAQVEYDALRSPDDGFQRYFDLIASTDGAVPVLRLTTNHLNLNQQVDRIIQIGRGGFARITKSNSGLIHQVSNAIVNIPDNDFTPIIDAGWNPTDILTDANWSLAMSRVFFDASPDRTIIICGSSFPNIFSNINRKADFPILERILFNEVRSNLNANLIYGDWASGRPPIYDDSIKRTVARIDLAKSDNWSIYRAQKLSDPGEEVLRESYREIAQRILSSSEFDSLPQIWAKYMIECTAEDMGSRIRSQITSAAVRMNLHIHNQAHFQTPELINQTDDPYTD